MSSVPDTKPYVRHDPVIGYRYAPNERLRLPRPGGGMYDLATNADGIRASRDHAFEKPCGTTRIIVLGDSYAAGQFVSNDQRFTEQMERLVPGLEIINLALEGTGTDQQALLYEHVGLRYDHDAVMILPFLQNIRRNLADARESLDTAGKKILRAKPRFVMRDDGALELRNVPVSREPIPADAAAHDTVMDENGGFASRMKTLISSNIVGQTLKKLAFALRPWEPFPEYSTSTTEGWRLMEAILRRIKTLAGARPLVIAPVFYDSYVRFRMARNYWQRFSALSDPPRTHVIDLLPTFQEQKQDALKCFQFPFDCHFSTHGHLVLAQALIHGLRLRNLIP